MTENQWPADQVGRRAVADLVPYARNARTHSDEQVGQIAASIKEWGWTVPILIDGGGGIIAGHARLMEFDPKYCDVIVRRWQEFTGREAVLEGDGRTFAQLVAGKQAA